MGTELEIGVERDEKGNWGRRGLGLVLGLV